MCERDGCENPGREYLLSREGGVASGWAQTTTHKARGMSGRITLCHDHALADLGVAIGTSP